MIKINLSLKKKDVQMLEDIVENSPWHGRNDVIRYLLHAKEKRDLGGTLESLHKKYCHIEKV